MQSSRLIAQASALAVLGCSPASKQENGSHEKTTSAPAPSQDRNGFPATPEDVTEPAEIRSTIAAFDEHLVRFGQRVRTCDHVVRIQIGKDSPGNGRGLAAYGAYCALANGEGVALCYEEAIGRFAMVARSFVIEQAWIEAFTLRTCADVN